MAGRFELADEADDPVLRSAIAAELKRLVVELHDRQGWRVPLSEGDPLRIYVARRDGEGVRRLAVRSIEGGRLVEPAIQLDATGLSNREIVLEVARLYAYATLSGYGAPDRTFLTAAAAEYLSGNGEAEEDRELTRAVAAAPTVDLSIHAASVGRLYVEEFARAAGGPGSLRGIWEKASESGEEILPVLLRAFVEATGEKEDTLLLRAAARLYASLETEPSPSRIAVPDLELGGLDAATPASFAFRHRSTFPGGDTVSGLKVHWPEQGAPAAAVVRYRDGTFPPDVVFFAPGRARTIPLSGVARIDWVVSGSLAGPPLFATPALVETVASFPYTGLAAQAVAGPGGPRIGWTTASHQSLVGWAVFREEVLPDGRIARTGPQILPSASQADQSYRYAYVDPETTSGAFYRYTVWAVTEDGILSRAFSATLRTPD